MKLIYRLFISKSIKPKNIQLLKLSPNHDVLTCR